MRNWMKRVQYLYENNNGGQFKEMHFTTKEGLEGSVKTWMVWMEIIAREKFESDKFQMREN